MPYDWDTEGDFAWPHPVDLMLAGEKDPDAIRFAMAAHLSEMAFTTEQQAAMMNTAMARLEQALGR